MKKPRNINLEGATVEIEDWGKGLPKTIWIDVLTFNISSARRLYAYLGRAIAWMEENESK